MKRAGWFLSASLCLVVLAISSIRVHTDITDFFFSDNHADSSFLIGRLQSQELARRYVIGFTHPDVDEETALDFIAHFQGRLEKDPSVQRVWSDRSLVDTLRQLIDTYLPHRIHLFSLQPARAFPALFTPEGLDAQASRVKQALLGPDPGLVKSLIARDPMLLTLDWLSKLQSNSSQSQDKEGYMSLFAETRIDAMDIAAQARFQQRLSRIFRETNQSHGNPMEMEITGVPIFAVHIKNAVTADIRWVSSLSVISILLLFLLLFRSLRALLVTAILMLTTISSAALVTHWTFGSIHGLTLALGTTLIGVCIDYPIHAMVHTAGQVGGTRVADVRTIWPAMILGGITTLIGYLALGMSGFPGLQQIALFSGTGIIVALLITRFSLPDLIALFNLQLRPRFRLSQLLSIPGVGKLRLIIFIGAALSLAAGGSQIQWSSNLDTLTPDLRQLQEKDRQIRSRLTTVEPGRFILIEGKDMEQALQLGEQVQIRLQQSKDKGALDAFFTLYPWMASEALQYSNQQQWNSALNEGVEARWQQALRQQGLVAEAFPPLQPSQQPPLNIETLKKTPVWALISPQLEPGSSQASVVIWLGKHDPKRIESALEPIPQARYFSQQRSIQQLATQYRQRALDMLLLGMAGILLLLAGRYRSISRAIWVLTPAILSVSVVIGVWGLVGEPLGILHLIGLLLVSALCVDYGIFFSENRGGNQQLTFQAIFVSALTSAVSFACLGIAENPVLHALAWTVAPGVVMGFLLCPVLLQGRFSG